MGRRYIEVFRSKKTEYYHAVAAAVRESQTNGAREAWNAMSSSERALAGASGAYGDNGVYGDASAGAQGDGTQQAFVGSHHAAMGASAYGTAAYAGAAPHGAPPMPHGAPGVGLRGGVAAAEHTGVLKLRGLPFSATKDDIIGFFGGAGELELTPLVHDSIHIVTSLDGRPSGVAFAEFQSPEEAKIAMARDRQSMGTRYVELFASSREEATRAATSGR
jgi:heterogeneous nuclear ribonucleoprotein F/H